MARSKVEPWGEDRADRRAATNTLHLISTQASESLDESVLLKLANALLYYLESNQPESASLSPAEIRRRHG